LGRVAIFEILSVTDVIRSVITEKTDIGDLRKKAIDSGMVTLRQNAIISLLKGITTYQEVVRVTW
jgi:type II secretory ATPase GspE/PulE/Tfp pilus assembly ATPase PilB-like protein